MPTLKFKIISPCFQDATSLTDDDIDFYLEESNWNDYSYYTSYCLHATKKITQTKNEYLGDIRIMKKGQNKIEFNLLRKKYLDKDLIFDEVPADFVSLSFTLELFKGLNRLLDINKRKKFIKALHLILSDKSDYFKDLESDECFIKSLMRDSATLDAYELLKAKKLLLDEACYYDLRTQNLMVKFPHVENQIQLKFSCLLDGDTDSNLLPNGTVIFIGKNGSGKSTAIYKLARLLYANPTEREKIKETSGILTPNNIGISKLFLISYSPFDNFILPGVNSSDYQLFLTKEDVKSQRLVYCGIRDIRQEYKILYDNQKKTDIPPKEDPLADDRQHQTFLKPLNCLAEEFYNALKVITFENNKYDTWSNIIKSSKLLHPSLYNDLKLDPSLNKDGIIQNFTSLSTGHKFFLHTMAHLVAYIEDDSLILFDEPENHLHPPLLSFMMSELRKILASHRSVMLIATHSPVILQETFAQNVYVVRKDENHIKIQNPRIETYGENLGSITSEVFDLTTDVTKYYDAFDFLFQKWQMHDVKTLDNMLVKFQEKTGLQLSSQMESYLINLYITRRS